jgi:trypsin-like peptidase
MSGGAVAYASGAPGGNIADPVVRAADIAKPAVVRILTIVIGQLDVTLPNGQSVTFPTTPQNGANGYPLVLSGTGAFISAHGDLLTADHVVNPIQDDKQGLDQGLQQEAAQDIADYINQNLKPAQPVSPNQIAQDLASGQLTSNSHYQQKESRVYLSTDFSGPLTASSLSGVEFATVDQIKQHSPFSALDIAIIHVNGMDNMPMLQLDDSATVQQQDNLTIIGFPGNGDVSNQPTELLTSSINQVLVSSIKTTDTGAPLIQVGGNVEQGDSGGPALDNNGNVVGIVSFGAAQTAGSTSFLRTSNSAKPLIQAAGINTTPSAFQQMWSKAFTDYSATSAGHWHQAKQEFQQVATQFPQFKALTTFLQYATTQAQSEPSTGTNSTSLGASSGGINPLWIVLGGIALLGIFLVSGVAFARRGKPAMAGQPSMMPGQMPGYPSGQGYGMPPANGNMPSPWGQQYMPGLVPQTPPIGQGVSGIQPQQMQGVSGIQPQMASYTQPEAYQRPATYGGQSQQHPPVSNGSNMAAFGAPTPVPQAAPVSPDATQWSTWPCGHTNRSDARFCGICGGAAPSASGVQSARPFQP